MVKRQRKNIISSLALMLRKNIMMILILVFIITYSIIGYFIQGDTSDIGFSSESQSIDDIIDFSGGKDFNPSTSLFFTLNCGGIEIIDIPESQGEDILVCDTPLDYKDFINIGNYKVIFSNPKITISNSGIYDTEDKPRDVISTHIEINKPDGSSIEKDISNSESFNVGGFILTYYVDAVFDDNDIDNFNHYVIVEPDRTKFIISDNTIKSVNVNNYLYDKVDINNMLVDGLKLEIEDKITKTFFIEQIFIKESINIGSGQNRVYVKLPTDTIGVNEIERNYFINVNGKRLLFQNVDKDYTIYPENVEVPVDDKPTGTDIPGSNDNVIDNTDRTSIFKYWYLMIIIILILITIIVIFRKGGRGVLNNGKKKIFR